MPSLLEHFLWFLVPIGACCRARSLARPSPWALSEALPSGCDTALMYTVDPSSSEVLPSGCDTALRCTMDVSPWTHKAAYRGSRSELVESTDALAPGALFLDFSSHRSVLQGQIPGTTVSVGLKRGASSWMRHCARVYCGPLLERGASLWMRHCAQVYCGRLSVDL